MRDKIRYLCASSDPYISSLRKESNKDKKRVKNPKGGYSFI